MRGNTGPTGREPGIAIRRIVLTGMSGTGKSTIITALAERGYPAFDADADDLSELVRVPRTEQTGLDPGDDWVWRADRIQALLASEAPILFLGGCSPNPGAFYPQLDHILLLTAPPAVLVTRLATRTTNPYGKRPAEVARARPPANNRAAAAPLRRSRHRHHRAARPGRAPRAPARGRARLIRPHPSYLHDPVSRPSARLSQRARRTITGASQRDKRHIAAPARARPATSPRCRRVNGVRKSRMARGRRRARQSTAPEKQPGESDVCCLPRPGPALCCPRAAARLPHPAGND